MASSSTLKPLASNPRCLFTPFSSPKYSPNRSLSLPFKSISFSLSCFHSDRKNSSSVGCVAQKGSDIVEVAEDEEEEEEEDALSEEAKVFIGNLSYEVDSEKLAEIFGRAGVVEIAEVIYDRGTNQSRGFAFVTMSTVEEADKAVEMFNRYDLNGRLLTVSKAAPKRAARPERIARVFDTTPKIYVGNLPWQVDNDRLEQIFSEHGKVMDARVIYDSETGRSRGFGFVTLSTETEVQNAIGALDGQSLEGRSIKVNIAESRPARSF